MEEPAPLEIQGPTVRDLEAYTLNLEKAQRDARCQVRAYNKLPCDD